MPDPKPKRRYSNPLLAIHQHLIQHECDYVQRYIGIVAGAFKREADSFSEWVEKRAAQLPEDNRDWFFEDVAETHGELAEVFPQFAWQSTFAAIYSFLEFEMLAVAKIVGKVLNITHDPEHGGAKGIFAAEKFLRADCGIRFPSKSRQWKQIDIYNHIRNAIVHDRGKVSKRPMPTTPNPKRKDVRDPTIRRYVRGKSKLIRIDHLNRLELTEDFCVKALKDVEELLTKLVKLGRRRIKNV